jgi:hypothetical protein
MTDEDAYEARLSARVDQWVAKHPEESDVLRLLTRQKFGTYQPPPEGSLRAMVIDRLFRDEVRKRCHWPTFREWIAKESA